jgi:16S rRNA processing protein RimM
MDGFRPVCVGMITAAHGVRGAVKIRAFTADARSLPDYGPFYDEAAARRFDVTFQSFAKDHWLAKLKNVEDRNAAEALRGTRLYIDRAQLPATEEDEFYHADLIGLEAVFASGETFGTVKAVYDFGGGDMLEIARTTGGTVMLPFTRAAVPAIDLAARRLTIAPPEEIEADDEDDADGVKEGEGEAA